MIAIILILLSIVFAFLYFKSKQPTASDVSKSQQKPKQKQSYGSLRIFFGSQTGTAAKLSQQLAEQGQQHGFQCQVVDLKDVKLYHFEQQNSIGLFLMSNTGEGQAPENSIKWMNVLKGKQSLDQINQINWKYLFYCVFGLGNTQYEHYNKIGKDCDKYLQKKGANRLMEIGLGDDNCSLQDDFQKWRSFLWPTLKEFRKKLPQVKQAIHAQRKHSTSSDVSVEYRFVSKLQPLIANYKIYFKKKGQQAQKINEQQLDFKTKGSLKGVIAKVSGIKQLRQNTNDGSTLQLLVDLPQNPQYNTAGNIALYPKNDPLIIRQICNYFGLNQKDMDTPIGLQRINQQKKLKLNFVPSTLRSILEQSIDIQGKLTRATLKKLSKFKSNNQNYFVQNSSKNTVQFQRITQNTDKGIWYNLIKLIQQYQVQLAFQDYLQISDSIAPRLFTIASHYHTQKSVVVAASIVQLGLISKYIQRPLTSIKAQLRKSTFTDAMSWKKVIFVAAGTGLAPFRGYIQQKIYKLNKKQNVPKISLFFGCKHQQGDFIYKQQLTEWKNCNYIQRLYLAFSRDTQNKIYVQNLLERQIQEIKSLENSEQTAIYICGSLAMGQGIINVLTNALGGQKVKQLVETNRIIKQLW